jgi:hypothetical protein
VRHSALRQMMKLWRHTRPCDTYVKFKKGPLPGQKVATMGKEKFFLVHGVSGMFAFISVRVSRM